MHKNVFLEINPGLYWWLVVLQMQANTIILLHRLGQAQGGSQCSAQTGSEVQAHFLALPRPVAVTPSVATSPRIHIWRCDKRRNEKPAARRLPLLDSARFLRV